MINPNAKHSGTGIVTALKPSIMGGDLSITVKLLNGSELNGFVEHKTLKIGDMVQCTVGFRIISDQYVIESVRKVSAKRRKMIENIDSITFADVLAFRKQA